MSKRTNKYDVIIVGAGAAGVGMGVVLKQLGVENYVIVDRHGVGASFERWPQEMRFISPSFTSNGFGLPDLNSVAIGTSPAFSLRKEHPSGKEYAAYLRGVANHFELPVQTGIDVRSLKKEGRTFYLSVSRSAQGATAEDGELRSKFVIWAAGEFQYPRTQLFAGSELCRHNATVDSWQTLEGDDFVIVGGYESGIDAAVNLVKLGKRVTVVDDTAPWETDTPDPSLSLSPYTASRLQTALRTDRLTLNTMLVASVARDATGYFVRGSDGEELHTGAPPILATGFVGSLSLVSEHFKWHPERYHVLVDENDESSKTKGLFLVGPAVRHDSLIFCFIYKFRQRFAVVGRAIGERLGLNTSVLELYRQHQMYLDDLSCCDDSCAC